VVSDWLATLEQRLARGDEEQLSIALVSIAYLAGAAIELPADERRAASRRALLLLAAGGDPGRGLDLDGRAVKALASELESAERLELLSRGLDGLLAGSHGLAHVGEAVRALRADLDVAWRAFAASVLAEELDAGADED
jgi:hypothetical protein